MQKPDEWRIRHRRAYCEGGSAIWYYSLERKTKFLFFWDKWEIIDHDYYSSSYLSQEDKHKRSIELLEKKRMEILEDEAQSESIVKEWK